MSAQIVQSVEEQILFEREGSIAYITFNRPHARNAITVAGNERLRKLLDQVRSDSSIHVLVLRGAGDKAFCSGHDLKENAELPDVADIHERREETAHEIDLFMQIWNLPQPVIASISGYCVGLGVALAMVCDYIIASENARFGEFEVTLGYAPLFAINPWKMAPNRAKELSMFSEAKTAQEMYIYNVVNKVVPQEELDSATRAAAKRLSEIDSQTLKTIKYQYNHTYEIMGMQNALLLTQEVYNMHRQSIVTQMEQFKQSTREHGFGGAVKKLEEESGAKYHV